jgi:hypothetical protein
MERQPVSDRFELRHAATDQVSRVTVPARRLFAIDGFGPARTPDYLLALEAIRAVEDAVRAHHPAAGSQSVPRPPLECLWRPAGPLEPEVLVRSFASRSEWRWELLIEVPAAASLSSAVAATADVAAGAGREQPLVRVRELRESDAIQTLSVGGPASDAAALRRLLDAASADGLEPAGDIHQILLTDPARVDGPRERSIVRVPVRRPAAGS